jgi:hypothetical protein
MYNHNAVFKAYPNVVSFDDGAGAFDARRQPHRLLTKLLSMLQPPRSKRN